MKIIHCADLHLDSSMTSNLSKEQAKERKNELLRTFVRMVDYAKEQDVRIIIIAGDLFDTRNVSAMVRNMVKDAICTHPDIDFIYLKGNHDTDNFLAKLDHIPDNLKLFQDTWTSYEYGGIVISGVELTPYNGKSIYSSLLLDLDKFNIVTMHGQLTQYENHADTDQISLNALKNKGIDYLALGHVHEYQIQKIDHRGTYAYPGCLEGRGFDECGEKGFILLEIEEDCRTWNSLFVPFATRQLCELEVDISDLESTTQVAQRIEERIKGAEIASSSLVKLILTGQVPIDSEVNIDYLQDLFRDYFYYEKIVNQATLFIDPKSYSTDVSLKGEFIRTVLQQELSEKEKSEIIRKGLMALSGEEISR